MSRYITNYENLSLWQMSEEELPELSKFVIEENYKHHQPQMYSDRNFSEDGRLGEIQEDGAILWNYERLGKHCFCTTPSKCQKCKLFPSCPGICSQKIIESGDEAPCYISKPFSIEDYVLYNYKLKTLQTK